MSSAAERSRNDDAVVPLDPEVLADIGRSLQRRRGTVRQGRLLEKLGRGAAGKAVYLLSLEDPETGEMLCEILPGLARLLRQRKTKLSETEIERFLDLMLPEGAEAQVRKSIAMENAELRKRYLEDWPCLSASDVHALAGARGRNPHLTASRWKKAGRAFAVPVGGLDRYPAFQFRDAAPHPTIARVLAVLAPRLSPWQIAFWFVTENGWLDGKRPVDLLDDPKALEAAARRQVEPVMG